MNAVATIPQTRKSVTVDMANRFGMEPEAFEATVRATCMPANASREEFAAFLLVAKEYELNPLLREIYAFPKKGGGIVPIVSIDGWINLVNSHAAFDGMEFDYQNDDKGNVVSVTCRIYRKDRKVPIVVTEFLEECIRSTEPWRMKRRMLRHKALIQCARYAFGFSGIYDEDEAERIVESQAKSVLEPPAAPPAPLTPPSPPTATKPEIVENVPYTEVAADDTAAAAEAGDSKGAAPLPEESPATPPVPEHEPFDGEEFLATLTEDLAAAQTLADTFDTKMLFAQELDQLTRSQREKAEYLFEQAEARIKAASKPAEPEKPAETEDDLEPPSPAVQADPFAVPASFKDVEAYRQWILVMVQSASTKEHATLMRTAWATTKIAREELNMAMSTITELRGLVQAKVQQLEAA